MFSFSIPDVWEKIGTIEQACEAAFKLKQPWTDMPEDPARDVLLLHPKEHPPKKGFATPEGQARMLHDLASIELQAMELGLRTLVEYPDAPEGFREELVAVTVSEAQHLRMCLEGIEALGYKWGDWPVHSALWRAVSAEDSLLDRILIVHRYLEGSGLDAGDTLIRRLEGTAGKDTIQKIVKQINFEEIGHVNFGSVWYREICRQNKIDAAQDFPERMASLRVRLPKRVEPINRVLRTKAGFSEEEIKYFEDLRLDFLNRKS
ncbi:ferritin-like domain-containing protein [Bdellovibrio bacteriovorus]|uniref:ferritin-like domain-containing protein n=1 Tax=Bdellovibrio bacteriovorus TaxID=959 RepID=UPI0021D32B77|nr:ferritin-like domain-containing protein [Bdellovibrio bacteriovorus]UXR63574.1 ferritin-like domain-containing protein [Bdellovibrio bacteriovorus]